MTSTKNINFKFIGILVVIMTFLTPVIVLVYRVGEESTKLNTKLEHTIVSVNNHKDDMKALDNRLNKSIIPLLSQLRDDQGILKTRVEETIISIDKLFISQNLMRQEIQTNAEGKLGKDDFYRFHLDLNGRLLYLERDSTNDNKK